MLQQITNLTVRSCMDVKHAYNKFLNVSLVTALLIILVELDTESVSKLDSAL
jgi:hypothetical protein